MAAAPLNVAIETVEAGATGDVFGGAGGAVVLTTSVVDGGGGAAVVGGGGGGAVVDGGGGGGVALETTVTGLGDGTGADEEDHTAQVEETGAGGAAEELHGAQD